jgi:hypothetical protein
LPDLHIENDTTRATANLPGLTIEVVHRRSPDAEAEQISINMQAVPSFAAFGRFLDGINPLAFWAQLAQAAWLPWVGMLNQLTNKTLAPPERDEDETIALRGERTAADQA